MTPDRELIQPDPLVICQQCGRKVHESETVDVFMDFKTSRVVCEKHYDEWLESEEKKDTFEMIKEALKPEF